jgi:hypothetical protein
MKLPFPRKFAHAPADYAPIDPEFTQLRAILRVLQALSGKDLDVKSADWKAGLAQAAN